VGDPDALAELLGKLGFVVTIEIEREIVQYELDGAIVRFEQYPDMDPLVEVEGTPEAIERAVKTIGLSRSGFTSERLPEFVARFEARTGRRASLSQAELRGERRYSSEDA
jgi:adenylate cyclase class IV